MTTSVAHERGPRFADALSARRSELLAQRRALDGPRAALRAELALVTLTAREDLAAALRVRRDWCGPWLRSARVELPAVLGPALDRMRERVAASAVAQAEAAVRRVGGGVAGPDPLPVELLPAPGASGADGPPRHGVPVPGLPDPPRRVGWVEAVVRSGGGGAVRVALVVAAGAPALGLTMAGGRVLLPLAIGLALAAVALLAGHRRAAVERERWGRWVDAALAAAAAATRTELDRALITLEHRSALVLERLAAERRAAVTAELRALGGPDAP